MAEAEKKVTMEVSPEALWRVITDYENYPKFVDGLVSTKVLQRKGNEVIVEYNVNFFKKVHYVLKHKEKPDSTAVTWEMVEGDFFKKNVGSWKLKAKGKDKVEVTYKIELGLPLLVPQAIVNSLVGTSLPGMLKSFEERARTKKKVTKKK